MAVCREPTVYAGHWSAALWPWVSYTAEDHPKILLKKVYALTERLVRDFEGQFGSRNCSDLLGCNISTKEGEAVFEAKKLGKTRCLDLTVKTTELVVQVLENHKNIRHSLVK